MDPLLYLVRELPVEMEAEIRELFQLPSLAYYVVEQQVLVDADGCKIGPSVARQVNA